MITLQLKRTAKNISNNSIKDVILENGEPLLVESVTNTSISFNTLCETTANSTKKNIYLNDNQSNIFIVKNDKPLVGTTLFVEFTNANNATQVSLSLSVGYAAIFENGVRYLNSIGEYESNIRDSSQYNWGAGDKRVFVFDGNYWIIQLLDDYKENSYLFIGNGKDTVSSLYENGTYISVSKYISNDMIKNGSITIKKLDPNIDLASKEALEQIEQYLYDLETSTTNNFNDVNDKISLNKIYYVTCDTIATASNKVVSVADLIQQSSYNGLTLVIKFTYGISIADYEHLTLEVKNFDGSIQLIPPKPFYMGNNRLSKSFYWKENDTLIFIYNENYTGSLEPSAGVWSLTNTSASSIIANWCYNNDTTYINGGSIYTGSIDADRIAANSITADQIAVGSLPANVFSQDVQTVIGNLNQFKQQCASAGAIVARCSSASTDQCKLAYVTEETLASISTKLNQNNAQMPLTGTSIVVNFLNENLFTSQNGITFALTTGSTDSRYFEAPLGFIYINGEFCNVGIDLTNIDVNSALYDTIAYYKWPSNSYRTLMFDGTYWILSITTNYLSKLAEFCLNNNQTWIGGGTVITGTIVADQIQSGSIDTAKVSLVCYGEAANTNDVMNYGGVGYFSGSSSDTTVTHGIYMYGSTDWGDTDGKPDFYIAMTNKGMIINISGGRINGWNNKWNIYATRGIDIGADVSSGRVSIGRNADSSIGATVSTSIINGHLIFTGLPTSSSGLSSGSVYVDNGILKIVS